MSVEIDNARRLLEETAFKHARGGSESSLAELCVAAAVYAKACMSQRENLTVERLRIAAEALERIANEKDFSWACDVAKEALKKMGLP
jgi:hypothetical protein